MSEAGNKMVSDIEGFFSEVKQKLDLNHDGKLDAGDLKVAAIAVGGEIWHILTGIVREAEPALPGLMMAAVSAATGATGDKRKAALQGVEQGLIAIGKTAVADQSADEASRIGEMVGLSGNTVDQLRTAAVSLLGKNGLKTSAQ